MLVEASSVYSVVMAYSAVTCSRLFTLCSAAQQGSGAANVIMEENMILADTLSKHAPFFLTETLKLLLRSAQGTKWTKYSANMQQTNATTTYCYSVWLSLSGPEIWALKNQIFVERTSSAVRLWKEEYKVSYSVFVAWICFIFPPLSAGDYCEVNVCSNGGTCVIRAGAPFICICPDGFSGETCNETETGKLCLWGQNEPVMWVLLYNLLALTSKIFTEEYIHSSVQPLPNLALHSYLMYVFLLLQKGPVTPIPARMMPSARWQATPAEVMSSASMSASASRVMKGFTARSVSSLFVAILKVFRVFPFLEPLIKPNATAMYIIWMIIW